MTADDAQRSRDRDAIREMDAERARDGLSVCKTHLQVVDMKLAALFEARASMIAKGDRHAAKNHAINEDIRTESGRRGYLEWFRNEYQERLNTLSRPSQEALGNSETATVPLLAKSIARRKSSKYTERRDGVIFGALQAQMKGIKYCSYLDEQKLNTPLVWQDGGCPPTYKAAYKSLGWRKKIQDQKYRFRLKYEHAVPKERERVIQSFTRFTR